MATQGQWQGQWAGQWAGATEPAPPGAMSGAATIRIAAAGTLSTGGSATPGDMAGAAVISMWASGALIDATVYKTRFMGTGDWPGASINRMVREAQQRAAQALEDDIDHEMVCILSAAIL